VRHSPVSDPWLQVATTQPLNSDAMRSFVESTRSELDAVAAASHATTLSVELYLYVNEILNAFVYAHTVTRAHTFSVLFFLVAASSHSLLQLSLSFSLFLSLLSLLCSALLCSALLSVFLSLFRHRYAPQLDTQTTLYSYAPLDVILSLSRWC